MTEEGQLDLDKCILSKNVQVLIIPSNLSSRETGVARN